MRFVSFTGTELFHARVYRLGIRNISFSWYANQMIQMFARLHRKAAYSGTGVGLSIIIKVLEKLNNYLQVETVFLQLIFALVAP